MKDSLITVIVPVYKVEAYLDKCIEGIVNQTYRSLEIILVDDGSPDNCPQMCDDWAKKDPRIRVIHKHNGGASAARNAGLDIARGEYIGFVDSDDFIDPNMFEILIHALTDTEKKMACCESFKVYEDQPLPVYRESHEKIVHDTNQALEAIFEGRVGTAFWRRLFHNSILRNIRFPEGEVNEEYPLLVPTTMLAGGFVLVTGPLYYYRIREGSVTNSGFLSEDRSGIVYKNLVRIQQQLEEAKISVEKSFRWFCARESYFCAAGMEKHFLDLCPAAKENYRKYRKIMWKNIWIFLGSKRVQNKDKVVYILILTKLLRPMLKLLR